MRLGEVETEQELLGIGEQVVFTMESSYAPVVGEVTSVAYEGWVQVQLHGGSENNRCYVERKRVRRLCTMTSLLG